MFTLALVGAGRWGNNYIKTISTLKNVKIKYICSPNIKSNSSLGPEYIKLRNYKNLVLKKDIDGIIIATPSYSHYKIASFFIRNKQNVLIEKPLSINLNQANKIVLLSIKYKTAIMVGHLFNYNKGILLAKRDISKIGNLKSINFISFSNGPIPEKTNDLWERAYHDIYLLNDFIKKTPLSILCNINKKKTTTLKINIADNFKAIIQASSSSIKKIRKIKIIGEKGEILIDDIKKTYSFKDKNKKIKIINYLNDEPLRNEILYFKKMILSNGKSNLKEALRTVEILDLAQKSFDLGGKLIKTK